MLVLTRRLDEVLQIGDDISLIILGCSASQVKIGIVAPKDIPVHREEIYQLIKADRQRNLKGNKDESKK